MAAVAVVQARAKEASTREKQGTDVRRFVRVLADNGIAAGDLLPGVHAHRATPLSAVLTFIGHAATAKKADGSPATTF